MEAMEVITDIKLIKLPDGQVTLAYKQGYRWWTPHTIEAENTHDALSQINEIERKRSEETIKKMKGEIPW